MKKIKQYFSEILKNRYPSRYQKLELAINEEFNLIKKDIDFSYYSKNPMDKRMPASAYLLAIIKVLDNEGVDYEDIRKLILDLVDKLTNSNNILQRYLGTLAPFVIKSYLGQLLMTKINNRSKKFPQKDGFLINVLTSKEETLGFGYGIDILECGICKLFSKHNYEKFAPILCEVDYLTSSLYGLQLIRSGTIANGNKICDFRYKRYNY